MMKGIIPFLLAFCIALNAQTDLRFVNYGLKASPGEGDDNYIQVINIKIPRSYTGNAYVRLFDISCGSSYDIAIGTWNSRFRFSLYKNELSEDDFLIPGNRAILHKNIISHFEIGKDSRFTNVWYSFANLMNYNSIESIYSLVVEGVDGDDGNDFALFVSSDSLDNKPIDGVKIYSYEPTLALKKFTNKISYKILPRKGDDAISLHIFDFDGTKSYFSSLLRDEEPIVENNPLGWSDIKYQITSYESENYCTIDIGPEYHEDDDVTFYFTDKNGNKLPIQLPSFEKNPATIPTAIKKINYTGCNSINIDLSESYSPSGNQLSYKWLFEDGKRDSEKKIQRTFSKPGRFNEEVLIEENSNAITRAWLEKSGILINAKPIADAGEDLVGIPGQQIVFDAYKSNDPDGRIIKFTWTFGDGASGSGIKTTHSYATPGKYIVTLRVEDDYSDPDCNYSVDTAFVNINSQPVALTKEKLIGSVNQIFRFDGSQSNDSDGTITKYTWEFQELGIKEGAMVDQSFSKPGNYLAKLIVQDDSPASNNQSTVIVNVFINDPPIAVAGSDRIIADKEEITFDGSKSNDRDGKIISYNWNFGDGTSAAGDKVKHVFAKPGKYTVLLNVRDNSSTGSDSANDSLHIIVNDRPIAKIENEIFLKDGNAFLDASKSNDLIGSIVKYLWNFGDGIAGEGKSVSHIYKVQGTYQIILKVIDNLNTSNNFSFDTSKVIINKRPIADIGPNHIITTNQNIRFNSSNSVDPDGKIIERRWFINDKLVSEKDSFEYLFSTPNTYSVRLEVVDDFKYPLTGYAYAKVKVNNPPVPIIDYPKIVSPNQKVKFDAAKSIDGDGLIKEFAWSFSDGFSAKGKVVERSFINPGTYSAVLTIKDDDNVENSIVNDTIMIKVNYSPLIKINDVTETCDNVVTLDASKSVDPDGDDLTFHWEFPDQIKIKAGAIIMHNFKERGILPVTISADDGLNLSNSIAKKTIMVKIHQPPVADAGPDTTACAGDIVIFNGLKSRVSEMGQLQYEWTFDDSSKQYGSNIFKIFKKGGIYTASLKVSDNSGLHCNTSIDTKVIKVIEAPIADAGPDISSCANKPVKFDGSRSTSPGSAVSNYQWDFGDGESGAGVNPVHIYNKSGLYKVILTITGDIKGKCDNISKDEFNVTITDAPSASFTVKDSLAENYETVFDASASSTASGNIISYNWNFGDEFSATGKIVKHKFSKYGNYNIALTIKTDSKDECNSAAYSKSIYVNAAPIAKAAVKKFSAVNEIVHFDASSSYDINGKISSYNWNFGDGSTGKGINVVHEYLESGRYKIVLTVIDDTNVENNFAYDTTEIFVNSSPIAKFDLQEWAYPFNEILLDGSGSYDSNGKIILYEWFINDEKISEKSSFRIKLIQGLKKIRLRVKDDSNQLNNTNELTQYIRIYNYPIISLPRTSVVCSGESFSIIPSIKSDIDDPQIKFSWLLKGSKTEYNSKDLNQSIINSGNYIYYFEIRDLNNHQLAKDSINIVVNTPPHLPAFKDTTIFAGYANDEIIFNATDAYDNDGDILKITWKFGDGKISNQPISVHRFEKEGTYKVELEVDDQKNTKCSKALTSFNVTVRKNR